MNRIRFITGAARGMGARVVCQVVEMENPPRQLLIGNDAISYVMPSLEARIKEIREFAVLSNTTDFD